MKKAVISICITLSLTIALLVSLSLPVLAQGGDSGFLDSCRIGEISEDCKPPTLQQFEFLFVNLLVTAWALGGLLWVGYFINIARLYYTGDTNKIEEAKKRFGKWVLGFALYYLSWVIVGNVLSVMITPTSDCYSEFAGNPMFRFFFAEVCNP